MRRIAFLLLVAGAVLLGLALFLGLRGVAFGLQSYLACWLFWSALPFGALPVVMLVDLAGPGAGFALEPALRRLLVLTPIAALLMIPVLLHPAALFGWASGHGFSTAFGHAWMTHGWFIARSIIYVVLWTVLALLFFSPPTSEVAVDRRRGLAGIALFVYAISATLASVDWAMAVEPDWMSAEFGLLWIAAQVAIAVSFAVLLAGAEWRSAAPGVAASFLLGAVGIWIFTQFIQFIVIWSGDKSADISWYLHRSDPGSRIVVWFGFIAGVVIPVLVLVSSRLRRRPLALPVVAVLVICAQAIGMLWLITPSLRQHFILSGMDVLQLAGLGGVMLGVCLLVGPFQQPVMEAPHHV